jgi:2-polyprenyl-6-methoxyphenol hydroxylase-like FAD-dependent oxidoreductase
MAKCVDLCKRSRYNSAWEVRRSDGWKRVWYQRRDYMSGSEPRDIRPHGAVAERSPSRSLMTASRRVLVVGGGVAGLAAARALHRKGVPFLMVESRATLLDEGLAVNLPGNAITALQGLGLVDELSETGSPVRRREYRNERGRLLFSVDETEFWGQDAQPRCVRRSDLVGLLARGLPNEVLRHECRVTSVTQAAGDSGAGPVVAGLADGSAERCDLLVGADGVRSTVRREVFGEQAPRAALLSDASWRFMTPNPGVDCWTVWTGSHGAVFLLIPADHDEAYGWVSAPGRALGALPEAFAAFPKIVRETLDAAWAQPIPPYHSPLEEVRIPSWSHGRVLLTGDAAHATAPVWAQGAALALEDAQVLAELLDTREDWDQVGSEYERRRRPRVEHVAAATDRLSRLARVPSRLRDVLVPLAGPRSYRAAYQPMKTPVLS